MLTTLQLVEPTRLDGTKYESGSNNSSNDDVLLWRVTSSFAGSSSDKHKQEQILTVETTTAPTLPNAPTTTAGYVSTASLTSPAAPLPTTTPISIVGGASMGAAAVTDATSAAAAVSGLHNHHQLPSAAPITTATPLHVNNTLPAAVATTTTTASTISPPPPLPLPTPTTQGLRPTAPVPPPSTIATSGPLLANATNPVMPAATSPMSTTTTPSSTSVLPVSGMMMGSGPGGATEMLLVPPPEFYRVNHPLQGTMIEADKVVQALANLWPQLSSTATTGPDLDRTLKCLSNPETFTLYLATRVAYVTPAAETPTVTTPVPPIPVPVPVPGSASALASPTGAPTTSALSNNSTSSSSSSLPVIKIQEIIGCLTLISLNLLMSTRAHIEDLVVSQSCRGMGVGKALMKRAMYDAIHVKKCNIIDLTSKPDRIQARNMYESLGFKIRETGAYRYYVQQQ